MTTREDVIRIVRSYIEERGWRFGMLHGWYNDTLGKHGLDIWQALELELNNGTASEEEKG
jgi:hypothetical protein